jgi:3-hydroxyisobutyrate dehydrogenase-like beta-hydroxyacid dehydrogenase
MNHPCVGIVGMGDMGAALAKSLVNHGVVVLTTLEGRSEASRQRAVHSGVWVKPDLVDVVQNCDVFLSVVPPAQADSVAQAVAASLNGSVRERQLIFADCNAISPDHASRLATRIEGAGGKFIDASIIGPPPGVDTPRLYASGDYAEGLLNFDGMGISVRNLGIPVGGASALKMLFSGVNKGFNALSTTMLIAAERLELGDFLEAEISKGLPGLFQRMTGQIPYLPVNAERLAAEMLEIAQLMTELSLPDGFHKAAAEIFRVIDRAYGKGETRETFNSSRTARDVARAVSETHS